MKVVMVKQPGRVLFFIGLLVICFYLSLTNAPLSLAQTSPAIIRVAASGSDTGTCGSAAAPCRTIQYAVNQAGPGATIRVAQGTYVATTTCLTPTGTAVVCILNKHLTILGGYTTSNWSVADPQAHPTIIDGQDNHRGIHLWGATTGEATLYLAGFTIQNGRAQGATSGGDSQTFAFGGGMLADRSQVILKQVLFRNNQAIGGSTGSGHGGAAGGGGLALRDAPAGTSLEEVLFEDNEARGGAGPNRGGFAIGGGLFTFRSAIIGAHLTFTNNRSVAGSTGGSGSSGGEYADAQGAGAAFQVGSHALLQHVSVTGNVATGGNAPNGNAGGAFGAGIFIELASTVNLADADLRDNVARGGNGANQASNASLAIGGGLTSSNSNVIINRTTVVNNTAQGGNGDNFQGAAGGGGIAIQRLNGQTAVSVSNSVIADNVAAVGSGAWVGGGGGGLYLQGTDATIVHTTLARNRLSSANMQGKGIVLLAGATASVASLANSIVAEHSQHLGTAALHVQPGNTMTIQRALFTGNGTDTGGGGTINGLGSLIAGPANFVSPGTPSYDYHILGTSAARDQATNSTTPVDIDNESRASFAVADLGADEYAPIVLAVLPAGNGTLTLRWQTNTDLIAGVDHYRIIYSREAGASAPNEGSSPINAGIQSSFTLTGLTNDKAYTFTVEARDNAGNVLALSNTVSARVVNHFVYVPVVFK